MTRLKEYITITNSVNILTSITIILEFQDIKRSNNIINIRKIILYNLPFKFYLNNY